MDMDKSKSFPNQDERSKDFKCSIGFTMNVIGSKWRAIILWHVLKEQPIRYGALKRSIPHISHKILSQELRKLETDKLVARKVHPTVPPSVEYSLTKKGLSLERVLEELCNWGKEFML